jgi:ABC-type Mn2+/Zn2+ transport system permease subunit
MNLNQKLPGYLLGKYQLIGTVTFSVLFALVAGILGLVISYYWGSSAGAAISLMLAGIFAVTFCLRKVRA